MSLLILITGNELHRTFKTTKDETYVQRPLDFISYQFETARRNKKIKIHPNPHDLYKTIFCFLFTCVYLNTEDLT